MWTTMKNNLLGKQFLSCSSHLYRFRKHVSYGFPIINFCKPRVHYETPCISSEKQEVSVLARARDTSIVALTRLWFGSIAGRSKRSPFYTASRQDPKPIQPLFNAYRKQRSRGAKLTIHFNLIRGLRITGRWVMQLPTLLSPHCA
jgi:hypothetical protein